MDNLAAAFPPPPREYLLYTEENIKAFKADPSSVSEEIANALVAPPIPDGPYTVYGETWYPEDKLPTLLESGIDQLYPENANLSVELKKLARSLVYNFMEVLEIMSNAPEQFLPKIEHMRTILLNAHHLLNQFRPHQSRETLIERMQSQVAENSDEIERLTIENARITAYLEQLATMTSRVEVVEPEVEEIKEPVSHDLKLFAMIENLS